MIAILESSEATAWTLIVFFLSCMTFGIVCCHTIPESEAVRMAKHGYAQKIASMESGSGAAKSVIIYEPNPSTQNPLKVEAP